MRTRGYGFIRRIDGLFPYCAIRRVQAQRAAIWYSGAVKDVHHTELLPMHSDNPLNDAERMSWRELYRRGTRIVRVALTTGDG